MDISTIITSSARLSSFSGLISIALWIVVYSPQLYLSYSSQSGEGLSMIFLLLWLAGDVTNLLGSYWGQLLPTMIILAVYYSLCDCILIGQVFYYRRKRQLYPHLYEPISPTLSPSDHSLPSLPLESDPLLSSFSASDPLHPISSKTRRKRDILGFVAVGAGFSGVAVAAWVYSGTQKHSDNSEVWNMSAQIVGWMSAFLYLGSRVPQIYKNMETKCVGLSLLMFAVAVAGNVTYVLSIFLAPTNNFYQHILINLSWIIGSAGTVFLDFIVLGQFYYYSHARKNEEKLVSDEEIGEN